MPDDGGGQGEKAAGAALEVVGMDGKRFDALTRAFGRRTSRRETVRRLGLGAAAVVAAGAGVARRGEEASATCYTVGCACNVGTYAPCGDGLECCAFDQGLPGSQGACVLNGSCGTLASCVDTWNPCTAACNWGDVCNDCCSGYCGDTGQCEPQSCTGPGCACSTGADQPCDWNLVCCPLYSGDLMGDAGVCRYSC